MKVAAHHRLHPFTKLDHERLEIDVMARTSPTHIFLEYRFRNFENVSGLENPIAVSAHPELGELTEGLWKTTCLEAFWSFSTNPNDPYWEFNLSPDLNWNIYAFRSYRKADSASIAPKGKPEVQVEHSGKDLTFKVRIPFKNPDLKKVMVIGISSVIERRGEKSYWALSHAGKEADFHDKRTFGIQLGI